ncbi:hypothetical protein MMC29_006338 [Sticta canariensis]|nr:hypothetical protein [Sticta canariensis]
MHSIPTLASSLLFAAGVIAQYGSGSSYGGGSDSGYQVGTGSSVSSAPPPASVASPPPAAGSSSPSGTVPIHIVRVSNKDGDLKFIPDSFEAEKGSLVQFQFYPESHSIVESTFDKPCVPINQVKPEVPGFFSGFIPVKEGDANRPTYTILVKDTKPIWYYCSRKKHCQSGMVGVINPPAQNQSRTITSFAELAKAAPKNITPNERAAGGNSTSSGSGSSGGTAIPISPSSTSSGDSNTTSPSSSGPATFSGSGTPGSGNSLASRRDLLTGIGLSSILGLFMAFA